MILCKTKIKIAMSRKAFTIEDVARRYGCSAQRMRIIMNSVNVTTRTLGKLAAALECDVTEIIE